MIREIMILVTISSLTACGTQDYNDTPSAEKPATALGWREAALKAKESPAVLIPPQSGDEGNKDCPESTLCIKAAYLGPWQWRELASRFPGHVTSKETDDGYQIAIGSADHIQIESDVFEHETGQLILCGKNTLISSSIFQGNGEFNLSGKACNTLDGGNISLIAYTIEGDPKIVTDGSQGADGANGTLAVTDQQATSGNPKAAKIEFDIKTAKGRWPISKAAADGVKEDGVTAALRYLRKLSQMGIYSEEALESHLNTNCQGCDKAADRWYKSPNAGCFLYIQDSGLFDGATAKIENIKKLNGADADPKKVSKGSDGQNGGNAGGIKILSSKSSSAPHGELSSLAGKGGAGGIGAYQLPGQGVTAQLESVFHRVSEKHWVGCLVKKNGKLTEVHDWKSPMSRTLELHFSVGGPTTYDNLGGTSGRLETPKGRDGKALAKEIIETLNGAVGKDGIAQTPDSQFETDPDFLNAFQETCSHCSPLKILNDAKAQ